MNYNIIKISDREELKETASKWFSDKWKIPTEEYIKSMDKCIRSKTGIPEWYIAITNDKIIGGLGVIENDFHDRIDLTPNVCAVYVEEEYRNLGIAHKLLEYVCNDMSSKDINTLYLVTDHKTFYEKYGWEFLCIVKNNDNSISRMYIHQKNEEKNYEDKI